MICSDEVIKNLEILNRNIDDFRNNRAEPELERLLQVTYFAFFRKNLTGCKNCLLDGLNLINYYMAHPEKMNALFQLKTGANLLDPANDQYNCTHQTLTDEKAIYHLRKFPDRIKRFCRFPENWEEIVNGNKLVKDDMTVHEIKEGLLAIGYIEKDFRGKNKAELLKMLNEG